LKRRRRRRRRRTAGILTSTGESFVPVGEQISCFIS
jgi:hypothetical protein